MMATTEGLSQEHHITFPQLRARSAQSSTVLFIPEILFEIGTYLQKQELWSSSLVCVAWHKVFSPFLNWTALNHCQKFLPEVKHLFFEWHCEDGKLCFDAILERIDSPEAAFGFHSARNFHLSNRYVEYRGPCSLSTTNERRNPRLDRLHIMIVEKSTLLEKLELQPRHPNDDHCYKWTAQLQNETGVDPRRHEMYDFSPSAEELPFTENTPMGHTRPSPRWPLLVKVILGRCRVDYSFLPVLINNAPALEVLFVYNVIIHQAKSSGTRANVFDCSISQDSPDQSEKEMVPLMQVRDANRKASNIKNLMFSGTVGLKWTDAFVFASQLPRLQQFSLKPVEESSEWDLPFITGFYHLEMLSLLRTPCDIAVSILKNAPTNLFDLRLFEMHLDRSIVHSLAYAHAHSLQYVCISECTQQESDHVFHLILCGLHGLRTLQIFKVPMICDPRILRQTRWVCRDLRELAVVPNSKCAWSIFVKIKRF